MTKGSSSRLVTDTNFAHMEESPSHPPTTSTRTVTCVLYQVKDARGIFRFSLTNGPSHNAGKSASCAFVKCSNPVKYDVTNVTKCK